MAFDEFDGAVPPQAAGAPSDPRPLSGEQRLMLAVLQDAIRTCLRYRTARNHPIHGPYAEARHWIESDDLRWPFSFARICEALGLEPGRVRATILRADVVGAVVLPIELLRITRLRRATPRRRTRVPERAVA